MFKEFFAESREKLKQAYLKSRYTLGDIEELYKKANKSGSTAKAYIQFPDRRSRSGITGGDVVGIKNGKVLAKTNYGDISEVDPSKISFADIIG